METALVILAVILGLVGIVGSVVPVIPGPPIGWFGMLLIYFFGNGEMSLTRLLIWLVVVIAVTVIDYLVPMWFTKLTGGSKASGWGATIGLLIGMWYSPLGMICGLLLGAFLAEIIFSRKGFWPSVKSAAGAFAGFLAGTGMKLITTGIMFWQIIRYI